MTVRNLDRMFRPRSVAFVGASARPDSVGGHVVRNLLGASDNYGDGGGDGDGAGFGGDIFLVNRKGGEISGRKVWTDLASLPAVPDLTVIATPPETIPDLIGELGRIGGKAAVVITAGFGEGGDDKGKARAQTMLDAARPHLLRIVGPNCVGLMLPRLGLNASFAPGAPLPGKLAFVSQSGAVITAVMDWSRQQGIGFSHMVSMGGMLDVDFGDMLHYLERDPDTSAVLLYIEAVTNARKFMSAARAIARSKPVIVLKAGRHAEGARAAASHTGAMAGADAVYDAAFRRAGLVRVFTMDEMFDAVETLALARRPRRNRLGILSNGGGFGVLATDTLIDHGGRLAELDPETVARLDTVLPATWSRANPVDIIGDAPGARYAAALEALADDRNVGAVLVLNAPTALASGIEAARAITASPAARKLPVLTSWLGGAAADEARRHFREAGFPTYATPSQGVRAFMHLVEYRRAQEALTETPPSVPEEAPPDMAAAARILQDALAEGRSLLTEAEAKALLAAYGIPVARTLVAGDAEEAVRHADGLGYPVAVKLHSKTVSHKSDVGGIELGIGDADGVRRAVAAIGERVTAYASAEAIDGYAVQPMVERPHAIELILGIAADPQFGPVLLFGHGGTAAETIDDKALALPPLNLNLAFEAMRRTRIYRLLRGYRDRGPVALEEIATTMVRLSRLVADHPQVAELDINPLLADADGVIALDARVSVAPADPPADQSTPDPTARFAIRPYPSELEAMVEAGEGRSLLVRPIRPEDEPRLQEAVRHMTPEHVRMRFFAPLKALDHTLAARLTQIDYDREMALVLAEPGAAGEAPIHGVVHLTGDPDFVSGEFAIALRSEEIGHGLGRLLMRRMIDYARGRGMTEIYGHVLAENTAMLDLADALGFVRERLPNDPGILVVRLALNPPGTG